MSRRERKKEKTKDNIIDCSIGLFKEKGFQETSMEEIAEKSDVSKGTLYNYFQDKESILVAYFQYIIADHNEDIELSFKEYKDIKSQLNNLLDLVNKIFQNHMELGAIYFKYRLKTFFDFNPFDNPQRSGLEDLIIEFIRTAQDNNELRRDIPVTIIARNFQFLYMNFFISSLYGKESIDVNVLKSQLIELFLNGAKL